VELIDPGEVAGLGAARLGHILELRSRERIERPALGTVLAGRGRPVEHLALLAVEARQMPARERRPEDAVAIYIAAARPVARGWRLINFRQGGVCRIGCGVGPTDIAWAGKAQ